MNWIWAENIHTGSQSKRICFLFDCQYWILSVITQQFKHTVYTSTQATTCSHTHLCTRTYTWELFEAAVRNRHSNLSAQHERPRTQERPKTHTQMEPKHTYTHWGRVVKKISEKTQIVIRANCREKVQTYLLLEKKKKKSFDLSQMWANGREGGEKKNYVQFFCESEGWVAEAGGEEG